MIIQYMEIIFSSSAYEKHTGIVYAQVFHKGDFYFCKAQSVISDKIGRPFSDIFSVFWANVKSVLFWEWLNFRLGFFEEETENGAVCYKPR